MLAVHAAESRQQHAAAEALASGRMERLLRAVLAGWSDWAVTRRRFRATSDLVRLCTFPSPSEASQSEDHHSISLCCADRPSRVHETTEAMH